MVAELGKEYMLNFLLWLPVWAAFFFSLNAFCADGVTEGWQVIYFTIWGFTGLALYGRYEWFRIVIHFIGGILLAMLVIGSLRKKD